MAARLKYLLISVKLCYWRKSVLVIENFLRPLIKTLLPHDKHYLLNRDNLPHPINLQLSQKQKTFPEFFFFFSFLKYILNFKHLPKKGDPPS